MKTTELTLIANAIQDLAKAVREHADAVQALGYGNAMTGGKGAIELHAMMMEQCAGQISGAIDYLAGDVGDRT